MYLAQVHVRNFRNLRDVTVDFKPGLNVLLGENNVGKTNLLDAIRVALGAASTGDPVYLSKDDRHRAANGAYVDEPIHIRLRFDGLSQEEQAEFLEALDYDQHDPSASTATIQYEWTYSEARGRWAFRRWGSNREASEGTLTEDVLQAVPVTFLGALRDAGRALAPGRQSRLAKLLATIATDTDRDAIESIGANANKQLQRAGIVQRAEEEIASILQSASGTDLMRATAIRASVSDFERMAQALRILLRPAEGTGDDSLFDELTSNGLGYNNLIFIATVLAELAAREDAALPLLMVEEPEAHLHPQLQTILATHLMSQGPRVQTLVTTHSPTIAVHVNPHHLAVMHRPTPAERRVTRVDSCGLDERNLKQLQRVLDVSRATLLFAQGVILVEGLSEALLIPALARILGINLGQRAVSVVPMAGVGFASVGDLFGPSKIAIPVAIVTDADPEVEETAGWQTAMPKRDPVTMKPVQSQRACGVLDAYAQSPTIVAEVSDLTLEYDLAAASAENALQIFEAWSSLYDTAPRLLTRDAFESAVSAEDKALLLWRAICRGSPQHGKTQLAQELAARLNADDSGSPSFVVPRYLERAIRHAARQPAK